MKDANLKNLITNVFTIHNTENLPGFCVLIAGKVNPQNEIESKVRMN